MMRTVSSVAVGMLAVASVTAQLDTGIRTTLQRADVVAKVKVVDGLEVEVLRVYGDGDASLVGKRITLEVIPWNGNTGWVLRTCLSVTSIQGATVDTHWLVALSRKAESDSAVYRNAMGEGLLGTRVTAERAPITNGEATAAILAELLTALDDPDPVIRESAIKALRGWETAPFKNPGAKLWKDAAVAARLLALANDPCEQVRWNLAWMIPLAAGDAGEAVLFRFLFDDVRLVRQPATSHLGRRGHGDLMTEMKALTDYKLDEWTSEQLQASFSGKMRASGVTRHIAKMLSTGKVEDRARSAWMLGFQDPSEEITTGLIEALDDEAFEVRRWAAWSLGRIGGKGATLALAARHKDPDARVLVQVGNSLIALGERRDGLKILRALATGEDVRAAVQAIDAAAHAGGVEALDVIATAVRDRRPLVRAYAGAALRKFTANAEHQVAALRGDLRKDDHPLVRAAVR